jgi:hypothetical protein
MVALNNNIDADLIFGVASTYHSIRASARTNITLFKGGDDTQGSGAFWHMRGSDFGSGAAVLYTPNAAKTLDVAALQVVGDTDTPYLELLTHRVGGVGDPTTALDALNYNVLTNWTPTLVWAGATPAAITIECYYRRIGKTVFFDIWISSADSNGTTGLTITLPSTPSNIGAAHNVSVSAWQAYGVAGTTYGNPLAYLLQSGAENRVRFLAFQAATDGQFVGISASGFYQEA